MTMRPLTDENYSIGALIIEGTKVFVRPGFDLLLSPGDVTLEQEGTIRKVLTNKPGVVVDSKPMKKDDFKLLVRFHSVVIDLIMSGLLVTKEDTENGLNDWYIKESDLSFTPWTNFSTKQKSNIAALAMNLMNITDGANQIQKSDS
jgi:hypothetical protein